MKPALSHLLGPLPDLAHMDEPRPRGKWGVFSRRVLEPALLLAGILGVVWLVAATGGIKYVYAHLMYLPLVLAAYRFGLWGGILAALAAGLCLGPLMPINVDTGEKQDLANWLTRMALFLLVAGLSGLLFGRLRRGASQLKRMLDTSRKTLRNVLKTFSAIITARDNRTGGHSQRVAHNAYSIGRQMGLSLPQLQEIYWAGLLHDIGKVWIPDAILQKPGKLTKSELALMQKHAPLGESLLRKLSPVFAGIAKGVGQHHERWDGRGYPGSLKGEAIHLYGRILAVADVFEALTAERPYRAPLPRDEAARYVKEQSGILFDPIVVAAFVAGAQADVILVDGEASRWQDPPMDLDEKEALEALLGRTAPARSGSKSASGKIRKPAPPKPAGPSR